MQEEKNFKKIVHPPLALADLVGVFDSAACDHVHLFIRRVVTTCFCWDFTTQTADLQVPSSFSLGKHRRMDCQAISISL